MTLLQRSFIVVALAMAGVVSNADDFQADDDSLQQLMVTSDLAQADEADLSAFESNATFELKASRRSPSRPSRNVRPAPRRETPRTIVSPRGGTTCSETAGFTHCSGPGGSTTCSRTAGFTHCSGAGGSTTCSETAGFTHCSGPGGSTTCSETAGFTHCSGPGGSFTCTRVAGFTHCN